MFEQLKPLSSPGKASFLIDGQFGSTGKGLAAGVVAKSANFDIATTNASANAGHTVIDGDTKFVAFHLPIVGVMQPHCHIHINAGAIIDIDVFLRELQAASAAFPNSFNRAGISIHPRAAVITSDDMGDANVAKVAGTKKGVGEALMRKVARTGKLAKDYDDLKPFIADINLNTELKNGASVMVEVPQGFDLGLNHGFDYPHCTSRDVTIGQAMADAGIHPHFMGKTLATMRTYPIRVGHIYGAGFLEDGSWTPDQYIAEHSGPVWVDQQELTWDQLGVTPETTTVTKRVRRVFTWSQLQYWHMMSHLRPDFLFLNFVNYFKSSDQFVEFLKNNNMRALSRGFDDAMPNAIPTFFGCGPKIEEVFPSSIDAVQFMEQRGWAKHSGI